MPCFDEPDFKSQFILSITRGKNFKSSFSNVRLNKTTAIVGTNLEIDTFIKSAPMSTYFMSIIVHNLQTARIYSPKYNVQIEVIFNRLTLGNEQIEYALNQAGLITDYIAELFKFKYPYEKTRKN